MRHDPARLAVAVLREARERRGAERRREHEECNCVVRR